MGATPLKYKSIAASTRFCRIGESEPSGRVDVGRISFWPDKGVARYDVAVEDGEGFFLFDGIGVTTKEGTSLLTVCFQIPDDVAEKLIPLQQGIDGARWIERPDFHITLRFAGDMPEDVAGRPALRDVVWFIEEALQNDAPVAFLNLCNGEEHCLYRWHWVTIVALDFAPDGSRAAATILDEGRQLDIDLAVWHNTTTLGGGFVWFAPI